MIANTYIAPDASRPLLPSAFCDRFVPDVALYWMPRPEYVPGYIDDDPISPEEEEGLARSWGDIMTGNVTVVPKSCTDEDFLRMLEE